MGEAQFIFLGAVLIILEALHKYDYTPVYEILIYAYYSIVPISIAEVSR